MSIEVAVFTLVNNCKPITNKIIPGITKIFGPNLSNIRPINGEIAPFIIAPGNKIRPAATVLTPSAFSKRNGSKIIVENCVIMPINRRRAANENIGCLKVRISSMGVADFNCLHTKPERHTRPTQSEIYTLGFSQLTDSSPAKLSPKTMPPNPKMEKKNRTNIYFWPCNSCHII